MMENEEDGDGPSVIMEMSNKAMFDILQTCTGNMKKKISFLEHRLIEMTKCPAEELGTLKRTISYFKIKLKKRWNAAHQMKDRFLTKNETWLKCPVTLVTWEDGAPRRGRGRPRKMFTESSERSKRRKTLELRKLAPGSFQGSSQGPNVTGTF